MLPLQIPAAQDAVKGTGEQSGEVSFRSVGNPVGGKKRYGRMSGVDSTLPFGTGKSVGIFLDLKQQQKTSRRKGQKYRR